MFEICHCGHVAREHTGFRDIYGGVHETGCSFIFNTANCQCWEFKRDNLRYLEEVANNG